MEDRAKLIYFIYSVKDELGFENQMDFENKIENNFNFRFKVQKFVFLSKYFGWNNHYKFTLYPRGPYSSVLAEDYHSNAFIHVKSNAIDFEMDSFKEFVEGKSEYDLEATSTILFYKSFSEDFSLNDAIAALKEIKPHIDQRIVEKAYFDTSNMAAVENLISPGISSNLLEDIKSDILHKTIKLISIFEKFEMSYNSKYLVLSLNYLKNVLMKETLDSNLKNDLLESISKHISKIDEIHTLCNLNEDILKDMNLNHIKESFNRLENYIGCELDITPRFNESEEFDIRKIYEEHFMIKDFILDEIIPKYDELVSCDLYFENEVGKPAFEFYIRYKEKISYDERNIMFHDIVSDIYDFCVSSNLEDIFKTISIFLVRQH